MAWMSLIAGSIVGGVARYLVTGSITSVAGKGFPYGTMIVNVSGCFLIGLFNTLAETKGWLGANERLLLMTGFCGAYTTFSTFMLETSVLMKQGEVLRALLNVSLSLLIGFAVFRLGEHLAS